ncbi:MAG: diadenylate cyclase CdaA [Lachnospiraceae bacterium]|nr:diadenylate cyclase CdaA [Lachnospiraceae bacterium]MDY5741566.1 diadenylate cyclase CdaA [Lachnospiraceae bacterium]
MIDRIAVYLRFMTQGKFIPRIGLVDIAEIGILAVMFYYVLRWIRATKAWSLLKGIIIVALGLLVAYVFRMDTILWIARNMLAVGITAVIIVFQPEFRRLLEQIGRKRYLKAVFNNAAVAERCSDATVNEIINATVDLSRGKTGALIAMEKEVILSEYVETGIMIDALVSTQLLDNIFINKSPLHDGAVIIRGNRIEAATCYLPLSENLSISKELGTRHRAAVGLSELTDALVIVVSEETGGISICEAGRIEREVDLICLKKALERFQNKVIQKRKWKFRKGADQA